MEKGWKRSLAFLNDIKLNRKFFLVALFGVILPTVVMVSIYTWQLYDQYEEKEAAAIESIIESVVTNFGSSMTSVQSTAYSYTTNSNINRAMADPELYSQASMNMFFKDLALQTHQDAMGNELIRDIYIYTERFHVLAAGESYRALDELTVNAWFDTFTDNPQHLMLISGYEADQPLVAMVKTFNSRDYFTHDLIYLTFDGLTLTELMGKSLLENYEGEVFLVNPQGQVMAATSAVYGKGAEGLIDFNTLSFDSRSKIVSRPISTEHHLRGWRLEFVLGSGTSGHVIGLQIISIILGTLLGITMISSMNYAVVASISSRLKYINRTMERSKQNELVPITAYMGTDEIGETADHFNDMIHRIQDLIHLDRLTKMMNRFTIIETAERAIGLEKTGFKTGIIFIDVDNFKNINDTYGHDLGDEIIVMTAERLAELKNEQISIGRFGGDEFIIVYKGIRGLQDIRWFESALKSVFEVPFEVDDKVFRLTVSAGAAIYPNHGVSVNDLIKKADLSLYRAKALGRNRLVVFDKEMEADLEERLSFEDALKTAFAKKKFYMNYQPYYYGTSETVAGFEGLVRWQDDRYGQVSPFRMVQTAESLGMIVELGDWIMEQCFAFAKKINAHAETAIQVSVNISVMQLLHNEFYEKVMAALQKTGARPEYITLEMTETVLIESIENSYKVVERLSRAGFTIAIDDFGTGYSSLSYLKSLPVHQVKIDKSFLKTIGEDAFDRELVRSVADLAHMRLMRVVAEGVETEVQKNQVIQLGCDLIQGYLLSRPLGHEEAMDLLKDEPTAPVSEVIRW